MLQIVHGFDSLGLVCRDACCRMANALSTSDTV